MLVLRCEPMNNTALAWMWVVASGCVVVGGSWLLARDALVVVIAVIVWVLIAGWIVTRLQES